MGRWLLQICERAHMKSLDSEGARWTEDNVNANVALA